MRARRSRADLSVTSADQPCWPVILAAGLGTRMRSRTPKVLHPLLGRPMLAYIVDAAREATGRRPVIVYSPPVAAIRDVFADEADFALQDEPRGSGDALRAGLTAVPDDAREVLVLNGDVPLIDAALLSELLDVRREDEAAISVLTVDAVDPRRLGRVVRDAAGLVERVVEAKDATDEELLISEINTGLYAMDAEWLRRRIGDLTPSAATGELYLTQLIELARRDGRVVSALEVPDDGTLLGINDRAELADAVHRLQARINEAHMLRGVTMDDPSTAYVEPTVTLAQDVTLEPNVILRGRTSVGEGTRIGAGLADRRHHDRARLRRLGERARVVRGGGRGPDRAVRAPPAGLVHRARRGARQLRRGQEEPPRGRRPPAPLQLSRRRPRRGAT